MQEYARQMPITGADQELRDTATQVYEWRVEKFEEMRCATGERFTVRQVRTLAESDCDLHKARTLLEEGCPILTAFDILS